MNAGPTGPSQQQRAQALIANLEKKDDGIPVWLWIVIILIIIILIVIAAKRNNGSFIVL